MVRKIDVEIPIDGILREVRFTRAALAADPIATRLLGTTDGWMGWVESLRVDEGRAEEAMLEAAARRVVTNTRLDLTCRAFGRDLVSAVGGDRSSARWKRFFPSTIEAFLRQPLGDQANAVFEWLTIDDSALTAHRGELERWARASNEALAFTRASATVRGTAHVTRERVTEDLTRARDGLHAALVELAHTEGLSRDWPDAFFRRSRPDASEPKATPAT